MLGRPQGTEPKGLSDSNQSQPKLDPQAESDLPPWVGSGAPWQAQTDRYIVPPAPSGKAGPADFTARSRGHSIRLRASL